MTEIITAVYDSAISLTNVVDDLASTGIPREKIRVADEKHQVQVQVGETARPEIEEGCGSFGTTLNSLETAS
jgi:hypothetical protein